MATNDPFDLTGRVALITGASSHGIGNDAAKVLAAHGAKVFLTARREDKLQEAVRQIAAEGGVAAYRPTDVSDEEECKAAVDACVAEFGRLDIMVLSAGISGLSVSGGLETAFDPDNWRKVLGINLDGVMFMVKHGWKHCAANKAGSIIPVASLAAWKAAGSVAYTATKGAIRALTPCLAKLMAPEGVRVNTLYPGFIETDMTHPEGSDDIFQKIAPGILAKIPLGRTGKVDDCANAVLYLASDASSFMTGQHLVVDGGELC